MTDALFFDNQQCNHVVERNAPWALLHAFEGHPKDTVFSLNLPGPYPIFRLLFPTHMIRAGDLARVMEDVAVRGTGEHEA